MDIDRKFWISCNHISQDAPGNLKIKLPHTSTHPFFLSPPHLILCKTLQTKLKSWTKLLTSSFQVISEYHTKPEAPHHCAVRYWVW